MKQFFLTDRFFGILVILILLFVVSYGFPFVFSLAKILSLLFGILILIDIYLLFANGRKIKANRTTPEKFSNGDDNQIKINIKNEYNFDCELTILDELPAILQIRDTAWHRKIEKDNSLEFQYVLKPNKRGNYNFGALNILTESPLKLVRRRYQFDQSQDVKVYPSFLNMRNQELIAFNRKSQDHGSKRMRRLGQAMEFEQIKGYVRGDDPRLINWKATAKTGDLMVNQYIDEKAQQVYCLVDKGRLMKMPFDGLSLLDYSINAAVAISNIALKNDDKVGLITFESKLGGVLQARRKSGHLQSIMEMLHNQRSNFKESNFELVYNYVSRKITQRSLLILFTNFESTGSLHRQLPFIKSMARKHLLLVVFYRNTALHELANQEPKRVKDIYTQTIAEQLVFEKQLIVKELKRYGVLSLLTDPKSLSIDVINKYLEIKNRRMV